MTKWAETPVLVTGAGGFIGSHLAERLVELGAKVRAFVHYRSDGSRGWLDQSPYVKEMEIFPGDIRDQESVSRAIRGTRVVFHLAALIGIPYSYDAPLSYVRTNVEGTLNVLQASRGVGVERLVHTSTSEVYGTPKGVPISEDHPLQGQSPYAASKIGADKMVEAFHLSFDLPVVTVRPFNTFGPRQSARAIVPTIVTQCLRGDRVVLGNLYPTRDLNFIANTVDGFLRAGTAPGAVGRVINLGSGRDISVGDLAQTIARLIGKPIKIHTDPGRVRPKSSEVERLLADKTRAHTLLGWEPVISLEDGLQRTTEWVQAHLDEYRVGEYGV